jgi:hypothetical protein
MSEEPDDRIELIPPADQRITSEAIQIQIPPILSANLKPEARVALDNAARDFYRRVLEEARRVSVVNPPHLNPQIEEQHVNIGHDRAIDSLTRLAHGRRETIQNIRELLLVGLGAGFGLIPTSLGWGAGVSIGCAIAYALALRVEMWRRNRPL